MVIRARRAPDYHARPFRRDDIWIGAEIERSCTIPSTRGEHARVRTPRSRADPENAFLVENLFEVDLTDGGGSRSGSDGRGCSVTRARFERATPSFGEAEEPEEDQ